MLAEVVMFPAMPKKQYPSGQGVHATHCCAYHGCKYSNHSCPVTDGSIRQEYPCEYCGNVRHLDPTAIVWGNDFLRYDLLKLPDIPKVLEKAHELFWMTAYPSSQGAPERLLALSEKAPSDLKKSIQVTACAWAYALWIYEHMFKPPGGA